MWLDSLLHRYKHIHEEYMLLILKLLFMSPYKDILWFKWWTLAYLCYDLDRFSTDLDIDLLDLSKEQEIIKFLNDELPLLWDVSRPLLWRDLHRWKFKYDRDGRVIKIELNKRKNQYTQYEMKTIDGIQVQCQTANSMATNKLLALWNRRYNRDLYDTHFFLKKWYIYQEDLIQDKQGTSLRVYIQSIIDDIPLRYSNNTILHQIWEVIDNNKQKSRVKSHLVQETIDLLSLYLTTH